ncbi:MAG: DUF4332 domain-containing protein [Promethearchaeota archaeon]
MDETAFRQFLKRGGRKPHVVDSIIHIVRSYEAYLRKYANGKTIDEATLEDITTYVTWFEEDQGTSTKRQLWAIRYYYRFTANREMANRVAEFREVRTRRTRKEFQLRDFRGINLEHVTKLEAAGICDVEQMRTRGATPSQRTELAKMLDIPEETILELVKLSDLARLPGVKGIRARLYYEAGVDTLEKMAQWDPEALRHMLIEFVEKRGFNGIAPLPKEAANSVKVAGELPKLIEF